MRFTDNTETRMVAWLESKGVKGDDEWCGLLGGASTLVKGAVVVIRTKTKDSVEILAPINPDERGTKIPISQEPAPLVLPKSSTITAFHDAMRSQAKAIIKVYRQAGISIYGEDA